MDNIQIPSTSNVEFEVADSATEQAISNFFDKSSPITTEESVKPTEEPLKSPTGTVPVPLKGKEDEKPDENVEEKVTDFFEKDKQKDETEKPTDTSFEDTLKKTYEHFVEQGYVNSDIVGNEFDGSEEAFKQAYDKTLEGYVKAQIEGFVESLPDEGKAILSHIQSGGTLQDYLDAHNNSLDGVDLENPDDQKRVIKTWLKFNDYTPDEINQEIEDYEAIGKTKLKAKTYLDKYNNLQETRKADTDRRVKEQQVEAQEQYRETVTSIKNILQKNKIKDISINKEVAQQLEDYVLKPSVRMKDGRVMSQFQYDQLHDASDTEALLARAYHSMKRYSIADLKRSADTDAALSLKKKLQGSKDEPKRIASGSTATSSYRKPDINLDWNNLFGNKK